MRKCLALAAILAPLCWCDVRLPAILSDHMVLQEGMPVRIWGSASAGERIVLRFQQQQAQTQADGNGQWEVFLRPLSPAPPSEMTVEGANRIVLRDVVAGEVWVGSGQSNMERTVKQSKDADAEIAAAQYPSIRFFNVPQVASDSPLADTTAHWEVCSPETVAGASAAGYYFAREMLRTHGTPMGILHASWGGSIIQAWLPLPALKAEPSLQFILDDYAKLGARAAKNYLPGGLYNGMLAPLTRYAIRGVLWYQGESDARTPRAFPYRRMFSLMIQEWRRVWGQGSFPFLFVQLPGYETRDTWAVFRESQTAALELRDTGMAIAIDLGESKNVHPVNKQEIGRRLALLARAMVYHDEIVYSGPVYRQLSSEGAQLRAWFDHAGDGLQTRDSGTLLAFEIAGADRKFVPAQARIEDATVVVSSADVSHPVAIRYAWRNDPKTNLMNAAGLPASPFRTDDWDDWQ